MRFICFVFIMNIGLNETKKCVVSNDVCERKLKYSINVDVVASLMGNTRERLQKNWLEEVTEVTEVTWTAASQWRAVTRLQCSRVVYSLSIVDPDHVVSDVPMQPLAVTLNSPWREIRSRAIVVLGQQCKFQHVVGVSWDEHWTVSYGGTSTAVANNR